MKTNPQPPKVSVCIPVWQTEKTLTASLESVFAQNFDSYEILVLNDGSEGKDDFGRNAKKIVKEESKRLNKERKNQGLEQIPHTYLENKKNLGTLETRRLLTEEASGTYLLMMDSDDTLLPEAVSKMYKAAEDNSFPDIIHACFTVSTSDKEKEKEAMEKINNLSATPLFGKEIKENFIKGGQTSFLCGKLIKKETYLKAFSHIPFTKCVMAEDLLIYTFVTLEAQSYYPLKEFVYCYNMEDGITSSKTITSLKKWEGVCSAANVFTAIYSEIENLPPDTFTGEEISYISARCRYHMSQSILQLKNCVPPELQHEARLMLCDYWGEDFVTDMEKQNP